MKKLALSALVCSALLSMTSLSFADIAPTPYNSFYFNVANHDPVGARLGKDAAGYTDAYYISMNGTGGQNQLHVTNNFTNDPGQTTVVDTDKSAISGTFWVSTTGGRGYNDEIIILASVKGSISDDFSLNIKSSGYQWTPVTTAQVVGADSHYVANAVDDTFAKNDFMYGPQAFKPCTGTGYPFYAGQDTSDPSTAEYLMFIDLYVGNFRDASKTEHADARVDFSISGLYNTTAVFNAYAYAASANDQPGTVNWTNSTINSNASGYVINSTAMPTPIPAAVWLLGSGFSGMFFTRRKKHLA
jgi:hypothetical protein